MDTSCTGAYSTAAWYDEDILARYACVLYM